VKLPLLYFGTAHAALTLAAFLVARSPQAVTGFFYRTAVSASTALTSTITASLTTKSIRFAQSSLRLRRLA
jgi:hypothetical protein